MEILISDRPKPLIQSEPVCDRCGHGQGLHAEEADVECVVCIELSEGHDCPGFSALTTAWR